MIPFHAAAFIEICNIGGLLNFHERKPQNAENLYLKQFLSTLCFVAINNDFFNARQVFANCTEVRNQDGAWGCVNEQAGLPSDKWGCIL